MAYEIADLVVRVHEVLDTAADTLRPAVEDLLVPAP
ncbi:hypothetical protein FHR93_004653 [Geodermatophilus sabuli]|nr:hypothetical protein [Geodermatophilus sabuli]